MQNGILSLLRKRYWDKAVMLNMGAIIKSLVYCGSGIETRMDHSVGGGRLWIRCLLRKRYWDFDFFINTRHVSSRILSLLRKRYWDHFTIDLSSALIRNPMFTAEAVLRLSTGYSTIPSFTKNPMFTAEAVLRLNFFNVEFFFVIIRCLLRKRYWDSLRFLHASKNQPWILCLLRKRYWDTVM